MGHKGKVQLILIIVAPPDQVAEGERLFQNHAAWMEQTHHRSGPKSLLSYNLSIGPERSNPMDPSSAPTGNTCFVLSEVYETEAGVSDHLDQAGRWKDFPDVGKWMDQCKVTMVPVATIAHSLW